MPETTSSLPTASDNSVLDDLIKNFFFSGLLLAVVAIVISGKILAVMLHLPKEEGPRISIIHVLVHPLLYVKAQGKEVTAGFAAFFLTLVACAFVFGSDVETIVRENFGQELPQFHALCMLSAFMTAAWSIVLFVIVTGLSRGPAGLAERGLKEHRESIRGLQKKG